VSVGALRGQYTASKLVIEFSEFVHQTQGDPVLPTTPTLDLQLYAKLTRNSGLEWAAQHTNDTTTQRFTVCQFR